jgi:nicotinate phosphoribosyltransferase
MIRRGDPGASALFTDSYELAMARAYAAEGLDGVAVFEAFFRRMPERRAFVLAAGLDSILDYLEHWRFAPEDLDYLHSLGQYPDSFLDMLAGLHFTGQVLAVPEGTAVFEGEPLVRIAAPIIQAQLVETLVLNQLNCQCLAASKAARVVLAARGRPVMEFGSRRAQGTDAALKAARCAYLAGAAGTSNVLAGRLWDIPLTGTMAHSFVQAHGDEARAFATYARLFPGTTLLIDTYDPLAGVDKVIALARAMGPEFSVRAVRLDSGDLLALSREVRARLDAAGLSGVGVVASGDLDEGRIAALLDAGAPLDAFGVGTRLVVSEDAPSLDLGYKLVEYAGQPRAKLSGGKAVHPGTKQVRRFTENGRLVRDLVCREDEDPGGEPLLREVMVHGRRTGAGRESLATARERAAASISSLPDRLRDPLAHGTVSPVEFSAGLRRDLENFRAVQEAR